MISFTNAKFSITVTFLIYAKSAQEGQEIRHNGDDVLSTVGKALFLAAIDRAHHAASKGQLAVQYALDAELYMSCSHQMMRSSRGRVARSMSGTSLGWRR
jgi:hypothetical protein